MTRPGVKCSEIADELNEMLLSEGMLQLRTFGYGHSFGVISHYYGRWGDGHVSLSAQCDTWHVAGSPASSCGRTLTRCSPPA